MDAVALTLYLTPLVLGVIAYAGHSLDFVGSGVGTILGYVLLLKGFEWFSLILVFFVLGTIVTRLGYERKRKLGLEQKTRRWGNVIGNALAGTLFALLNSPGGAVSAFCAATADTFSSEVGMLSKEKPVSILTGKEVKVGDDGGITTLGSSAMFLGSFLLALLGFAIWGYYIFWIGLWAGVLGCMFDSILGDAFEKRGKWGNNTTNLISTLLAGLFGYLLQILFL